MERPPSDDSDDYQLAPEGKPAEGGPPPPARDPGPPPEEDSIPLLDPLTELSPPLSTPRVEVEPPPVEEPEIAGGPAGEKPLVEGPRVPTLLPFDTLGILRWPFGGGQALPLCGAFFLTTLALLIGWVAGQIPYVGDVFRVTMLLAAGFFVLPHCLHVTLASLAGAHLPPHWPSYTEEVATREEGAKMLALLLCHLAPAILAALAIGWMPAVLLALVGWGLFPGALLRLAGSGRLSTAHPAGALAVAWRGGARYLLCAAPGAIVLVTRFLVGDLIWGFLLESLFFFVLVYTGYLAGAVVRECEEVSEHLLALARDVDLQDVEEVEEERKRREG